MYHILANFAPSTMKTVTNGCNSTASFDVNALPTVIATTSKTTVSKKKN